MSNTPAPYTGAQAPATDGDNRYKSVQLKLKMFAQTMDQAVTDLAFLHMRMKTNAGRSEQLAAGIANADLDPAFVAMQNAMSIALGGAEVAARKVTESAREVHGLAEETRGTHSRLYQGLDDIRSSRRWRTPKPGFFAR